MFLPLALSWAAGAVVRLSVGYLVAHGLVRLLGTEARLDHFAWRLGLLHVPAVLTTALTVLAAVRVLPEERRGSRALYLSAALAVPLVALCYGYATAWQVAGIEGAVMPVVAAATGAAVGLGVDRLMEEGEPDALAGSLTVK
ncbi:hypothetical protein ABZ695_00305 [Streptomyces sp. NPDC006976]|uniref:hypothetical protein n=1 Tax=Streptomyces sp. NPDC006976 TaxID=3154311 RepID=UPI0033C391FC